MSGDGSSNDAISRARMMARIAAPLLSASIRSHDNATIDAQTMAENFSSDIHRVVPLAQILVDALKPQNDNEHAAVNALTAPVAAQLVAQNNDLLAMDNADELTRLLKPSLNVLASFCDRDSALAQPDDAQSSLARSLVAMTPIVGCLSRYAFGKSPAKRLTDILDTFSRAQKSLLDGMSSDMRGNIDIGVAIQEAAAALFTAQFEASLREMGDQDDPNTAFNNLLSQWSQSMSLLGVLLAHSAATGDANQTKKPIVKKKDDKVRPLRAVPSEEDEDGEAQGSSGSGAHGAKPAANPNPMSFFAKKGM